MSFFYLLCNVILCSRARLEVEKNSNPHFCSAQRVYALYVVLRDLVSDALLKRRAVVLVELLMSSAIYCNVCYLYRRFRISQHVVVTRPHSELQRLLICAR